MDLKVPIRISDEVGDDVIEGTGELDLASGEIRRVAYEDFDLDGGRLPADDKDYDFTVGTLSNNGKEVEFRIDVNTVTRQYSVSANELLEIKVRAAALFAGIQGVDLARQGGRGDGAGAPAGKTRGGAGRGRLH